MRTGGTPPWERTLPLSEQSTKAVCGLILWISLRDASLKGPDILALRTSKIARFKYQQFRNVGWTDSPSNLILVPASTWRCYQHRRHHAGPGLAQLLDVRSAVPKEQLARFAPRDVDSSGKPRSSRGTSSQRAQRG
jgi:hypothetical protein